MTSSQHSIELPKPDTNPLKLFKSWYAYAELAGERAEVAALATSGSTGPSVRMVLIKGLSGEYFRLFTHYQSRKAQELEASGRVALVYFWAKIAAQVRIEGDISRLSAEESDEYFYSRPSGSQLSAIVSPQSQIIQSHQELLQASRELEARAQAEPEALKRPAEWGGYAIHPTRFEFWLEGESRLHQRFEYRREAEGRWAFHLLAP